MRRFQFSFQLIGIAALLSAAPAELPAAPSSLEKRPAYQDAIAALRDDRPGEAAEKLTQLIEAAEDLVPEAAEEVRRLRLEAFVRSDDIGTALTVASDPLLGKSPEAAFWHGLALARANQHAEALTQLTVAEATAKTGFAHPHELWLNLAICRHHTGDNEAAIATLGPLLTNEAPEWYRERAIQLAAQIELDRERYDSSLAWLERPVSPQGNIAAIHERDLLRGQIALRRSQFESANAIYNRVARESAGTPAGDRAIFYQSEVASAESRFSKAISILLDFIEANPSSPLLDSAFDRLGTMEGFDSSVVIRRFQIWATDETQPKRQALSFFFQGMAARSKGDHENALAAYGRFLNDFPQHVRREEAQVQEAETMIAAGRLDEAAAAITQLKTSAQLPAARERLTHLQARFDTAQGRTTEAVDLFRKAMSSAPDVQSRAAATFNGALASVLTDNEETYQSLFALLERSTEDRLLPGDLLLERGLYEATNAETGAFENLENFVRQFSDHPRTADAEIALAELYLSQVPAQPEPARNHLNAAEQKSLTLDQREWLDYVAIWVEIAAEDTAEVIERARRFLDEWPRSIRRTYAYLVLGDSAFRNGKYAEAATYFEALATEAPGSPFAEGAKFFAGKSASRLLDSESQDRAWAQWNEIAESGGPLAPAARHEQGLLRLSQELFDEAAAAFESAVAMPNADPQLIIAALADKGEALYAKAALQETDSIETLEAAAAAFVAVANHDEASKSWRLQATVRRGKCLEALEKKDEALELYFGVVENGAPAGPVAAVPISEFDWFYRAGLAAIRLLQEEENWEMAVAVADRISQFGGPRAAEADRIADRLRLRHFIWQKPGK